MNDDELRRQYAALRRARAQRPASERPDAELIGKALNGELPEDECEVVLDRALTTGASADLALLQAVQSASVGAFKDASATTTTRSIATRRASRWWPLAAAAVLVIAVGVPIARRQPLSDATGDATTRYRAAESTAVPELIAPAGGAVLSARQRFVWTAVPGATSYSLELLDARGQAVAETSTKDTTTLLSASVSASMRGRITGWWVTAVAVDGRRQRSELRLTRER